MYEKALIAVEMTDICDKLLHCTAGLRQLGVREVVLAPFFRMHKLYTARLSIETIFRPELEQYQQLLAEQGYSVSTKLVLGESAVEVNRLAEAQNCDLVIVGSTVHSLLGEIFLGGVAGDVLHCCKKTLLVIRLSAAEPCAQSCPLTNLERVLYATDFSDDAENAFVELIRLVENGLSSVVLMHVQDSRKIDRHLEHRLEEFNTIDQERLTRLKHRLIDLGASDVRIELPYGIPVSVILERLRQGDVSMAVMGSQGRGFIKEIFIGSVSHQIARHAPVPVLLIPGLRTAG